MSDKELKQKHGIHGKYKKWPLRTWLILLVLCLVICVAVLVINLPLKLKALIITIFLVIPFLSSLLLVFRWHHKGRRNVAIFNLVLIVLILVGGISIGSILPSAVKMKSTAKMMKDDLKGVAECIKSDNFDGAYAALDQVSTENAQLKKTIDSTPWKLAAKIPVIGSDIRSIRTLLNVVDLADDKFLRPLTDQLKANPASALKAGDGEFSVSIMNTYLDFLDQSRPVLDEMITDVKKSEIKYLKIDSLNSLTETMNKASDAYSQMDKVLPVLRTILSDGSERHYLLLNQNTTEMHAGGGFPGIVGTIDIEDGIMKLGDFATIYDTLDDGVPAAANVTDQEMRLFIGRMGEARDATYNPEFPRAAQVIAIAYEERNGEHLNGIISMTPAVVQKMLNIVGPVTLPDGTVMDGTNATKVIEHDIYYNYFNNDTITSRSNDIADELFKAAAAESMDKFVDGFSFMDIGKYYEMYKSGVDDRTLQMWMEDPNEQQVMADAGVSGTIGGSEPNAKAGAFFGLRWASKEGWFVDISTETSEGVKNADGTTTYHAKVTLNNAVSMDEYEQIHNGYFFTDTDATIQGYLHLTGPVGGTLSNFTDNAGFEILTDNYAGVEFGYSENVNLSPGQPVVIEYDITTAAGVEGPLTFMKTPTMTDYR